MTRIIEPIVEEPIAEGSRPEPTGVFERIDEQEADYEFTIRKTATVATVTTATYELSFLYEQRAAIENQKAEQIAARDKELAEVDELIAEAGKLGVKVRPVEDAAETESIAP